MRRLAALVAVAALIAACGSSTATDDESTRSDDGEVIESGEVGAFRLRIGDCIAESTEADEFESVPVVPCGQEHQMQIVAAFDLEDGEYPGRAEVDRLADEGCVDLLVDVLSHREDLFEVTYTTFTPLADGWNQINDREVLCLAGLPTGPNTVDLLDTSITSGDGS